MGLARGVGKEGSDGPSARARKESEPVAVRLSLSGDVIRADVEKALGYRPLLYTTTIDKPRRDFLRLEEELKRFRKEWMSLLAEIRGAHGADAKIHLFPAVPTLSQLKSAVLNFQRATHQFSYTITTKNKEGSPAHSP
jgi:hypothetical protein